MKYIITFSIGLASARHRPGDICVFSESDFINLKGLFSGMSPQKNPLIYNVAIDGCGDTFRPAFESLRAMTGLNPVADLGYAMRFPEKYFPVTVKLVPNDEELRQAPWLYLWPPPLSLASFKSVEPDDTYIIRSVLSRRKIAFGHADTVGWMMLFTEKLKELFEESDLTQMEFRPVKKITGELSGLWQIWSPMVMPKQLQYWPGDYIPSVIRYEAEAVKGMPDFDVAVGAERSGWAIHNRHRHIIVSQRFRETAERLVPGQFRFALVAVGCGEDLKQRYTLPELAPPSG